MLGPSDVRGLAARLGLRPTKQRGQNFVTDPNTIRRIVRSARISPDDTVLEVGPGLGSLTLALLDAAPNGRVVAVEVDEALASALPATVGEYAPAAADRLTVVTADALGLTELPVAPDVLVANLPYNVAVPVLLRLLDRLPSLRRGLVMVQLEVADRLVAVPGSAAYGVPSVKLAWYAEARRVGLVGRTVFWPQPRVDSGLVAFERREVPGDVGGRDDGGRDGEPVDLGTSGGSVGRELVFAVVDAAFAQRRKTLRAALSGVSGSGAAAEERLRAAGVDPGARGEQLAAADFVRLAGAFADVLGEPTRGRGNLSG